MKNDRTQDQKRSSRARKTIDKKWLAQLRLKATQQANWERRRSMAIKPSHHFLGWEIVNLARYNSHALVDSAISDYYKARHDLVIAAKVYERAVQAAHAALMVATKGAHNG